MSYQGLIASIKTIEKQRTQLQATKDHALSELEEARKKFETHIEALQLIGAVGDKNTEDTLNFVTGVINRTLSQMFPNDARMIQVEKTIYRDSYTHLNVTLKTANGVTRDMSVQSGTGLRQVVAFLFTVCLIQIRKDRPLLIMDEILSGVHPEAKKIIKEIMLIMSENMQFLVVEYGFRAGKVYQVDKPDTVARIYEVPTDLVEI